jgi:hypothetical protein
MQDIDRPAEVQRSPVPTRCGRVRVDGYSRRGVPGANRCGSVSRGPRRRRDIRQDIAERCAELQRVIPASLDLKAFFVNGAMVPATQQDQVWQRRGPAVRPVFDVVGLAEG